MLSIYKASHSDCSNGGMSSRCNQVTLVGTWDNERSEFSPLPKSSQIFEASDKKPAVIAVYRRYLDYWHLEPCEFMAPPKRHMMAGGCYCCCSDSRFRESWPYPLPLHDRHEG